MSVYEDIINKKYKRDEENREDSIYNSIIKGTYKINEQENEQKSKNTNKNESKIKEYESSKKDRLRQVNANRDLSNLKQNETNKTKTLQEFINKDVLPNMKTTVKDASGLIKSSNAFDDGYQFGDVSKTVGSTLANAGASFVEGIGRIGEGASDFGTHIAAQVVDWAGNKDWANRIRQTAMEDRNKELFDNIQKDLRPNSVLGDKSEETLASMGYSTGLMAFEMNPLTSKIGTGLMFSTASAGGLNESYSKEGVTNTQAWIRGLGQGAIETAVERASGLFGPVGSWDKSLSNAVSSRISSGLGKLLVRTGVQGLAEGSEEIASYTLNKIFDKAIDKVSNGRGATFSEKWNWEEVGEQFGIAFLSASLMGMGSSAYEVGQIVNNDKLNLTQAINEAGLRTDVKAEAELLNEDIEDIKKELKKNPSNTELTSELKSKYAQMNELVTNNVFMQEKTDIKEDEAQLRLQEAQDIIDNANRQENNTNNIQTQQIIQQENKTAQNQLSMQIKEDSNNFSKQIDAVKNGTFPKNDMLVLGKTPQVLKDIGLPDLPITMTQKHLDTIMNESGKYVGANYHNLGEDIVKQLPEAINNPLDVVKSNTKDDSIVLTTYLADKQDRTIVASIKIDGKGSINDIRIDTNVMTSAYGRNNYDKFMQDNLKNGNLLYDIDRGVIKKVTGERLQLPIRSNFLDSNESNIGSNNTNSNATANSITPSNENVKPTNYSMQNEEDNTQILPTASQTVKNNAEERVRAKQNVANSLGTLYNNNERESGVNEGIYSTTNGRNGRIENAITDQRGQTEDTGIGTKNISQGFKENRQKSYEKFIEYANKNKVDLDTVETKSLRKIANELGINAILFNGDGNSDYIGMTDKQNPNNVYIDINQKEIRGEDMLYHEFLHSRKRNNDSVYIDKVAPIEQDIVQNYSDVINNFIEEKGLDERYKNYPELIAEEIVADYTSKHLGNLEIDYNLPQFYIESINRAVDEMVNSAKSNNTQKATTVENNSLPTAQQTNNTLATGEYAKQKDKTLNPTEISNLTMEDASTTPKLKIKKYVKGNRESSFLSNIVKDAKFLNEDLRQQMGKEENIRYYKGITNEQTLEKAYKSLQENGQQEVNKWYSKESKSANAEDVAKGWILLKQYQDTGDYQSAVEVAKKMRDIGTTAGQTVQAYNILSRLTPEGMFYYAQSELTEAYNKLVDGKSKAWIDKNAKDFNLTPQDTEFIKETMQKVSTMEDGYNKKLELAKIQKLITDKLPSNVGQKVKTWMRISMLFNPKTQVRNVLGNAVIMPVNMFSDSVSTGIDKLISKKTGVRTTGNFNIKSYSKGFGKGIYESYSDFKNGVNTRNIEGNRFEIGEGKSFSDKNLIGKNLNRVDSLLSFALDVGDRGFYEATFTNSINNQLALNNATTPTQEMIDIATTEALQRTWQDNNAYTQTVLSIRNALNGKVGKKKGLSYGLGDILIPFAKTPANLTKAIVDYSPAGLVNTLVSGVKLKNSLKTGQYTAQLQHKFVQNLGKATAGSFLYVVAYALAKAGIATGGPDKDKDVKNFMKNSLGISSYSIKIGDKTFTYDWAQPVSAPLSIMTNIVNSEDKNKALLEGIVGNMDTAGSVLLEQSFLQSINEVLNDNDGFFSGIINQVLNLPARAIPTFSKQISDMIDGTQRTTFEYDKPIESAVNSFKAKIPGLSKTLPASVDTLGNQIQKYGGDNSLWNVMFNPSNVNKGKLSEVGQEIYNIYKDVGDKTIFPRTAPYYIDNKGKKIVMNAEERNRFQTISGKYVESSLSSLMKDSEYKKLNNEQKANTINEIVSDSYSKAKYEVLGIDSKEYKKKRETLNSVSAKSYYDYKFKTKDLKKDKEKLEVLSSSNYSNKEKQTLYENYILSDTDKKYSIVKDLFKDKEDGLNIDKYLKYKLAESNEKFNADKKDDGSENGKSIIGSGSAKRFDYINSIQGASYTQKLILYALDCKPSNKYQKELVVNYIKSNYKEERQKEVLKLFGVTFYKDGTYKY